ncbi:hypothetical protein LTR97_011356 [Elasticomyces elasticus]|uniref:Uncharacterized protein n=1 Tax=Elasticomyces elasticus TaxID=574655 RepID=A0AAN7ZVK6_9PEZI|nr:hypothetical protein LTR97_011356 [Elasticomyces elasticus]
MAVQTRSQSAGKGKAKPKRATKTKKGQPKKSAASVAKAEKIAKMLQFGQLPPEVVKSENWTRIPNSEIQQLRIDFHQKYLAIVQKSMAKTAKTPQALAKRNKKYHKDIDAMKVIHKKALEAYRERDHAAGGDYEIVDERPVTGPMLHGWSIGD